MNFNGVRIVPGKFQSKTVPTPKIMTRVWSGQVIGRDGSPRQLDIAVAQHPDQETCTKATNRYRTQLVGTRVPRIIAVGTRLGEPCPIRQVHASWVIYAPSDVLALGPLSAWLRINEIQRRHEAIKPLVHRMLRQNVVSPRRSKAAAHWVVDPVERTISADQSLLEPHTIASLLKEALESSKSYATV